jgi:hypothetical protein
MERGIVLRLVGETVREIGVLTLVFAPLESLVSERPVDGKVLMTLMFGGVILIACGILLEAKNRWT